MLFDFMRNIYIMLNIHARLTIKFKNDSCDQYQDFRVHAQCVTVHICTYSLYEFSETGSSFHSLGQSTRASGTPISQNEIIKVK